MISIHALREEGDKASGAGPHRAGGISIHALREEGDSTPTLQTALLAYFYPRPPRGGRPSLFPRLIPAGTISIHALREEGDCPNPRCQAAADDFYPRPPRGGRLDPPYLGLGAVKFLSTPSARRATGGRVIRSQQPKYFYPRPPRGGRHRGVHQAARPSAISIHALREEGDMLYMGIGRTLVLYFYPRPPRGGRH